MKLRNGFLTKWFYLTHSMEVTESTEIHNAHIRDVKRGVPQGDG